MNRTSHSHVITLRVSLSLLDMVDKASTAGLFPESRSEYIRNAVRQRLEAEMASKAFKPKKAERL